MHVSEPPAGFVSDDGAGSFVAPGVFVPPPVFEVPVPPSALEAGASGPLVFTVHAKRGSESEATRATESR
jgi:hypothetical protein